MNAIDILPPIAGPDAGPLVPDDVDGVIAYLNQLLGAMKTATDVLQRALPMFSEPRLELAGMFTSAFASFTLLWREVPNFIARVATIPTFPRELADELDAVYAEFDDTMEDAFFLFSPEARAGMAIMIEEAMEGELPEWREAMDSLA